MFEHSGTDPKHLPQIPLGSRGLLYIEILNPTLHPLINISGNIVHEYASYKPSRWFLSLLIFENPGLKGAD